MSLLKGSAVALVLKVMAALVSFVVAASITRNLGVEQAGQYFFATSIVILFVSICGLGLNNSVLKYVSIFYTNNNNQMLNAIVNKSVLWSSLFSLFFIFIAGLILNFFPNLFGEDSSHFYFFLISVPSLTIISLISHAIQAKGHIAISMIIAGFIQPVSFLTINLVTSPQEIGPLAMSYMFSVLFALAFCIIFWVMAGEFSCNINFDTKILLASCSSLVVFQVFQQFNTVIGQLFLGAWGTNTQIAMFAVSIKVATLTSFIMFAVNRVVAPKFAALFADGDYVGLKIAVNQSKKIMLFATLPLISILLVFPDFVLGIFGDEYRASATVLRALAMIQFFAVWVGSVSYLLIMTGQEKAHRNNVIVSTFLSCSAGIIVVPFYPLWGAVMTSGLCVIITAVLSSRVVFKELKINMFSFN
tara:strand:+ start:788 stop:2035 length:1248 start_codon:yes stop_codon:yes gene_type:complete